MHNAAQPCPDTGLPFRPVTPPVIHGLLRLPNTRKGDMEPQTATDELTPVRGSRWAVLIGYSLLVACTQLVWLSFAPITAEAHDHLGVSEGAIGDLAAIQPLMYVLLALPTGRWMDRRFGQALSTGALLCAAGTLLRLAVPSSYGWILAGQFLVALAQPLVLNATTKIAARYFPPDERTAAISVATAAQFVGILVAALTGGPLYRAGGVPLLLLAHALITVAAAVAVLLALRVPPSYASDAPASIRLGWLRHDPVLWRLGGLLFIGIGVFNAVATWLDTILTKFGHPDAGGNLISVMTAVGILGAAILPSVAARHNHRRTVLLFTVSLTVVVFLAVAAVHGLAFITVALAVEGFVLMAGLPVALDWSELHVGPQKAGTATGFLLLAGNLGGVLLVLVVQALIDNPYLALISLAVIAAPGLLLVAGLPAQLQIDSHGVEVRPDSTAVLEPNS
jgi:predicted MFS family arabinose efflux permease